MENETSTFHHFRTVWWQTFCFFRAPGTFIAPILRSQQRLNTFRMKGHLVWGRCWSCWDVNSQGLTFLFSQFTFRKSSSEIASYRWFPWFWAIRNPTSTCEDLKNADFPSPSALTLRQCHAIWPEEQVPLRHSTRRKGRASGPKFGSTFTN